MVKIKVIIADDNKIINSVMRENLKKYEEIEVLGSAYSDEEERRLIESEKPEIVITDLMRNGIPSGLEIIKEYKNKCSLPKFLVISAGGEEYVNIDIIDGFIKKPLLNYDAILKELERIKKQIEYEKMPRTVKKPLEKSLKKSFLKRFKQIAIN